MIALRTLREAVFVAAPRGSGGAVRKQRRRDHPLKPPPPGEFSATGRQLNPLTRQPL